ncbi:hypothetical protein EDC94DRAFT_589608 [Helicostylum pulchrum]|nr:hypothetical protein EDC94DRAFT_589608 [Helicostylum pulchrum]
MHFTLLILLLVFLFGVQAAQISFKSSSYQQDEGLIVDTAQAHYESIIDDILSQHNEGILTELSFVIKDPQQMYAVMKPQVDLLYDHANTIQDVCVAQMPGMIANHIHELSNQIYSSVESVVSDKWNKKDSYYRDVVVSAIDKGLWEQDILDELIHELEILNMDITDAIIFTLDRFNMLQKLKVSLNQCQLMFDEDTKPVDTLSTLTENLWNAVLVSLSLSNPNHVEPKKSGFMGKYVFDLRTDIQSEMYSRVYELSRSIFEDLAFST